MYEYNLLSVACVYVISGLTNHLVFNNQLDGSSLEKTNFSAGINCFLWMGPYEISPFSVSVSFDITIVQVLFKQPYS